MSSGLNKWKTAVSGIVLSLVMAGCVKEEFSSRKLDTSVYLAPAVAVPVGYFDLRLIEMLNISENTTLYINSDSIISLKYSGKVNSENAGELFRFEPVSEEYSLSVPTGETIDLSSASYEMSFESQLPLFMSNSGGKAELDSIVPAIARISFSSIQFGSAYAELEIIIPGLKQGNQSFRTLITPNSGDLLIDVSSYHLELLNLPEQKNLIDVRINVFFPEQPVILNESDQLVQFRFEFFPDEWEVIYGFIGQESIALQPASFNTNFSRDFPDGEFYFADPLLKFKTINSFGVPLGMSFSPITAETLQAGIIELKGPGVPVPPDYYFPDYPEFGMQFDEAHDSLMIDNQNSNLVEITSSKPENIRYQPAFQTNPGEERQKNVIYSGSYFQTLINLEIPFHGKVRSLIISDTLAVDFPEINISFEEYIEKVIFKLYYENSYPADIAIQIYLAEENLSITDTLFISSSDIKGVDPTPVRVENPEFISGEIETSLPGSKLPALQRTRFLIGEAWLNTVGESTDIKIFDNQILFMNMGVIFDVRTAIEDF